MLDIDGILAGLAIVTTPITLAIIVAGVVFGVMVGVIPGLRVRTHSQ